MNGFQTIRHVVWCAQITKPVKYVVMWVERRHYPFNIVVSCYCEFHFLGNITVTITESPGTIHHSIAALSATSVHRFVIRQSRLGVRVQFMD